jgi:hypothetical protein
MHGRAAQVSYMILQRVSPVTHSIGNCLKRVIVIVASVIFFQNPMGAQNMLGAPPPFALRPLSARFPASKGHCSSLGCVRPGRLHAAELWTIWLLP